MKHDVIVVGAGIAGLTAAAYCAMRGYTTMVVEKEASAGGLIGTFERDGFVFDYGIRAFENSGILFPMLKQLGIEIPFVDNEIRIIIKNRAAVLKDISSLEDYVLMLKSLFAENVQDIDNIAREIKKVCGYSQNIYSIANPLFVDRHSDKNYIFSELLPWLLRYRRDVKKMNELNIDVNSFLSRYTKNTALIDMITQHFFTDTPTSFALSYFHLYTDYHYPLNGTGVLIKKIREFITNHGGEFSFGSQISEVDVDSHTLVDNSGNVYDYKQLIWCCDAKSLHMCVKGKFNKTVHKKRTLALKQKGSDSVLSLYLAVDLPPEFFMQKCGAHAFFTPTTRGLSTVNTPENETFEKIISWASDFLTNSTYEISCPSLRDPSLSPEGKSSVIVSAKIDYKIFEKTQKHGVYKNFCAHCTQTVLNVLDAEIFEGFKEKIISVDCFTPLSIKGRTGNSEGAITGWSFSNKYMPATDNLNKVSKSVVSDYKDILTAGQWTLSPSGFPVSILTGKIASDQVRKRLKGGKR